MNWTYGKKYYMVSTAKVKKRSGAKFCAMSFLCFGKFPKKEPETTERKHTWRKQSHGTQEAFQIRKPLGLYSGSSWFCCRHGKRLGFPCKNGCLRRRSLSGGLSDLCGAVQRGGTLCRVCHWPPRPHRPAGRNSKTWTSTPSSSGKLRPGWRRKWWRTLPAPIRRPERCRSTRGLPVKLPWSADCDGTWCATPGSTASRWPLWATGARAAPSFPSEYRT